MQLSLICFKKLLSNGKVHIFSQKIYSRDVLQYFKNIIKNKRKNTNLRSKERSNNRKKEKENWNSTKL